MCLLVFHIFCVAFLYTGLANPAVGFVKLRKNWAKNAPCSWIYLAGGMSRCSILSFLLAAKCLLKRANLHENQHFFFSNMMYVYCMCLGQSAVVYREFVSLGGGANYNINFVRIPRGSRKQRYLFSGSTTKRGGG